MKRTKQLLTIIGILGILIGTIYYFFIRPQFMNVIHTEINLEEFTADVDGAEDMIDWYVGTYNIPSVSAAIIENGKVSRFISKGIKNKASQIPVDENSIYQIASLSKMFTGIICKSLVLENKLDVEKSISEYLKADFDKATQEKFADIKLKHLLLHNSGLSRGMYAYAKEDIIKSLTNDKFHFEVGERWRYSNYGYAVIALILEQETGKSYEALLKEYVGDKYGINEFYTQLNPIQEQELVTPYWKHCRLLEGEVYDFGMQVSASGIFTNTKALSELLIQQIEDYNAFDSLKNISPLILNDQKIPLTEEDDDYYGYGIFDYNFVIEDLSPKSHNQITHGGDADGFASIYGFFPEYNYGIILLTSSGGKWFGQMHRKINQKLISKYN